ncbi:MAG: PAS domain-containing sensor histidine kinase [Bacteroidaceae bacterium]|nr:PAS domain-containing sensor histidine kinase [Bacteroidaceae bacterium]
MSDLSPNNDKTHDNSATMKSRLAHILRSGKLRLWFYLPSTNHFFLLSDEGNIEQEYNPTEFAHLFNRDGYETLSDIIFNIYDGKCETAKVKLCGPPDADGQCSYFETSISIASRDASGRPLSLLGVEHDVTEEVRSKQRANNMLMRYHTIFDSSQIDMLFYDKNGVLTDINDRACASFNVTNREMVLDGSFLLKNNPMYNQIPLDKIENTLTSSIVDFADFTDKKYRLDEFKLLGKMYYESAINPIRDENGTLEGIYMAGRDTTESVVSFHRLQEGSRQLRNATKSIQEYVDNINYALRVNNVRFLSYDPTAYLLEISDNVTQSQLRLTQLRCIRLASPRFRRTVNGILNRMDHMTRRSIEQALEITLHDSQGRPIWLLFNMVPIINAEGKVERYFGMCRSITEIVSTEQKLATESEKAKDSDSLMKAFLANMTKEIRTPLTSVVNYATKFNVEHDKNEEPMYVEEIKRNTNSLLLLINDVLFLSRLDAKITEFKKTHIDIVKVFDNMCQMGMKDIRPGVRAVIIHPYSSLVVDIDVDSLGTIIKRLCNFACFSTVHGSISVSYEYRHGQLTIKIEDTGVGHDQQTQSYIFERFARDDKGELIGTGLDLPIAQALTQQLGGSVDIQSAVGVGTTLWASVPCDAKEIRRRDTML